MTSRKLQEPLLRAGTKLRDQAITQTGTLAYKRSVMSMSRGRYNNKKTSAYGSKEEIYIIVNWDTARLSLDLLDFSEEEDAGVEISARMCDDYEEGELIEFSIDHSTGQSTTQRYKVGKVNVSVHNNALTKKVHLVPYRTDNF